MNNEEFKRKYFQTLQDLDDECLLIESLPNPELEHFNELMNYLIEHQDIYIKECQELFDLAINYDEKIEYGEYLKKALLNQNIFINHLNKRIAKEKKDVIYEEQEQKDVLYATNNGKILLEKNLKDILKNDNGEELKSFLKLIENLKNPETSYNQQKSRKLTNHTDLKDVYELKGFQTRLFYMYVDKYAVVIGALEKKTQNSEKIRKEIINMKYNSIHYRNILEQNLDNPKFVKQELENARIIEERLMKGKRK